MSETHQLCAHVAGNPLQAQCTIDNMVLCGPCTADYLEQLSRTPADIAASISFDLCGHNGQQTCNLCRVGVASCVSLLWSYTRLNGDHHAANRLARLLMRMKSAHGHLYFMGKHPHEQPKELTLPDCQ